MIKMGKNKYLRKKMSFAFMEKLYHTKIIISTVLILQLLFSFKCNYYCPHSGEMLLFARPDQFDKFCNSNQDACTD